MGVALHLLWLEDDDNDVVFFEEALRVCGFEGTYIRLRDGEQAIDYLEGRSEYSDRRRYPLPDVILTDLKMPRMDGLDFMRWLRAQRDVPQVPVLVFTSSELARDLEAGLAEGASRFFLKPASWSEWLQCMREILGCAAEVARGNGRGVEAGSLERSRS